MITQRLARGEFEGVRPESIQPMGSGGFVPFSSMVWVMYVGMVTMLEGEIGSC